MSARVRLPTNVEIKFATWTASRDLIGFSDPEQYDLDYDRLFKRSYKRNMEDRAKLNEKIGANFDARMNAIGVGLRILRENIANEAVIAQKEKNIAGLSIEQDQRDASARDIEDRKIAEQTRRAEAALAALRGSSIHLGGASADRRDARKDKYQEPDSEYEDEESEQEPEPEIVVSKKSKKSSVAPPEKKGKDVEERKEIITKAPVAKASGWISGLFSRLSATDAEVSPEVKMQKMARLAYHVKSCKPEYVLNDEEERAFACLQAFPHWLSANLSAEEREQLVEALLKKAD